ncbi:MAG: creatininase family protein [Spirochaetota bacterium]
METVKLEELNEKRFVEAGIDKAILVFGSTESHGGHLPFGTDVYVPYDVAVEVARRVDKTVVVPPFWYGMSMHYRHKPMCISLSAETVTRVVKEILESLDYWGIKKILIINGHDGNIPSIETAARTVKIEHPDIKIAWIAAWWYKISQLIPKGTFKVWDGLGHGGEGETSIVLATVPHLVGMPAARGMIPDLDPIVDFVWNFSELTDYGASGAPEKATLDKGKIMKEALIEYLAGFLKRMDAKGWQIDKR